MSVETSEKTIGEVAKFTVTLSFAVSTRKTGSNHVGKTSMSKFTQPIAC